MKCQSSVKPEWGDRARICGEGRTRTRGQEDWLGVHKRQTSRVQVGCVYVGLLDLGPHILAGLCAQRWIHVILDKAFPWESKVNGGRNIGNTSTL